MNTMINAKQVSIMAISAALYAVFFFLSFVITVPSFTLLYMPIILLGIFPIWFGWSGLAGSMIGAFIGGVMVENLAFNAWAESVTTLIIYSLTWFLITRKAAEAKTKTGLFFLFGAYALSLFVGLSYILWQFTVFGIFTVDAALALLLPTFVLNYIIAVIACPAIIRIISPKLKSWGMYSGTFWERRSKQK
jgi:hypothetical protein